MYINTFLLTVIGQHMAFFARENNTIEQEMMEAAHKYFPQLTIMECVILLTHHFLIDF